MDNQEILKNAPKGATQFLEFDGTYLSWIKTTNGIFSEGKPEGVVAWNNTFNQWEGISATYLAKHSQSIQNLDDIRQIEELKRERDELKHIIIAHQVADETGYIDGEGWVDGYSKMCDKVIQLLEAHNLEQQAKGIKLCRESTGFWDVSNCLQRTYLRKFEGHLKTQAKELV